MAFSFRLSVLLVCSALAAAGCTLKSRAIAPLAAADTLAANASGYFALRSGEDLGGSESDLAPAIARLRALFAPFMGIDLFDDSTRRRLGVSDDYPILISWNIFDDELTRWLASKEPPSPGTPLHIRTEVRVQLIEAKTATSFLQQTGLGAHCSRPGRIAGVAVEFACQNGQGVGAAWVDQDRRSMRWTIVLGAQELAQAVVDLPRAPKLVSQLQQEGFFTARFGYYATRELMARGTAGMMMLLNFAGLDGVDPSMREMLWSKGLKEMREVIAFGDSPPRLFVSFMNRDGHRSWHLTAEGQALFSETRVSSARTPEQMNAALGKLVRPGGSFATAKDLSWAIKLSKRTPELIALFLWPHALAFNDSHPGASPVPPQIQLGLSERARWRIEGSRLVVEPD